MSDEKEVVEFAFDKMEQYFNAAKAVIEQYGGDVAELGLMALRVEAGGVILEAIAVLSIFGFVSYKLFKISRDCGSISVFDKLNQLQYEHQKEELMGKVIGKEEYRYKPTDDEIKILKDTMFVQEEWSEKRISFTIVSGVFAAVASIGFFKLMNIWIWIGVAYPQLYAVHKFILN